MYLLQDEVPSRICLPSTVDTFPQHVAQRWSIVMVLHIICEMRTTAWKGAGRPISYRSDACHHQSTPYMTIGGRVRDSFWNESPTSKILDPPLKWEQQHETCAGMSYRAVACHYKALYISLHVYAVVHSRGGQPKRRLPVYKYGTRLIVYVPLVTKWVISETFFPPNVSA